MKSSMKLILCALAVVALTQTYDEVDWSKRQPSQKILGGYEATPHSIPYQAGLLVQSPTGATHFCGGSLISRKFVLTSAYCIFGKTSVQVTLGAHRINDNEATQVSLTSRRWTVHPDWDLATVQSDIAVIELPEEVELNENIQTIGLPTWEDADKDFAAVFAQISGWGRDSNEATSLSPVLRYVFADVITPTSCSSAIGPIITNGHICTNGSGVVGGCNGDTGGPLVYDNKQLGVLAFGIGLSCQINDPSVFTRTTAYLEWIAQNTDAVIN